MGRKEDESIRRLVEETVVMLCRTGVSFRSRLAIDGLLGVTVDDNHVFLININHSQEIEDSVDPGKSACKRPAANDGQYDGQSKQRKLSDNKSGAERVVHHESSQLKNQKDELRINESQTREQNTLQTVKLEAEDVEDSDDDVMVIECGNDSNPHDSVKLTCATNPAKKKTAVVHKHNENSLNFHNDSDALIKNEKSMSRSNNPTRILEDDSLASGLDNRHFYSRNRQENHDNVTNSHPANTTDDMMTELPMLNMAINNTAYINNMTMNPNILDADIFSQPKPSNTGAVNIVDVSEDLTIMYAGDNPLRATYRGFVYTKNRASNSRIYWRCRDRACHSRMVTVDNQLQGQVTLHDQTCSSLSSALKPGVSAASELENTFEAEYNAGDFTNTSFHSPHTNVSDSHGDTNSNSTFMLQGGPKSESNDSQ